MQSVAAEVITPRFRSLSDAQIDEKRPGDLVTVADHEAEELLTAALLEAYPDAVVLGEEAYAEAPELIEQFRAADHGFTVDPVDGTKNFVNGLQGPRRDDRRGARRRDDPRLDLAARARESRGWPSSVAAYDATGSRSVASPRATSRREPPPSGRAGVASRSGCPPLVGTWVCCGVDYPKLIEGEADYVLYGHTNPWDHLPGTLMVREAGGAAAHRDGRPYTARSGGAGLVVAADPATLERAREACADLWPR